jgi:seryl-tRNA synthetase
LKVELLAPIAGDEPSAIASLNYHQDYFGEAFGIRTADGVVAHTACVGFGLERMTLALYRRHGLDRDAWPGPVRRVLGM